MMKPCCFVGIGNTDQEMQHLSLEDKVSDGSTDVALFHNLSYSTELLHCKDTLYFRQ